MESIKEKENKQILFTASRKGQDLKVYQMEKDGQIRYGLSLDKKEATFDTKDSITNVMLTAAIENAGYKVLEIKNS